MTPHWSRRMPASSASGPGQCQIRVGKIQETGDIKVIKEQMMQNVRKLSDKDFIQALVVQQSGNSARLLDTMLHMLPLQTCMPGKENITNEVIKANWEHPCSAYASLRNRI